MPKYDYQCDSCDGVFERQLKIADRLQPVSEECPMCGEVGNVNIVIGAVKTVRDTPKLDNGFREVLSKIAERNLGSTIKGSIR